MGEYTKNLQLYKADTLEDGNDTFNINRMLNDNWDKIDEMLKKLPVQNGGWYINDDTTEEDKAEALKSINGFRHEKIIYGDEFFGNDIDTWFTAGIYNTNQMVVNTPCEDGYGTIVIFGSQNRTVQWFFAWNGEKSGMLQTRYKNYDLDWTEWKSFLPLDGSVPMSGNLTVPHEIYVSDGYIKSWDGEHIFGLKDRSDSDGDSFRQLVIMDTQKQSNVTTALRFMNVTNNSYANGDFTIFGEHNKPSGSYTGNSSNATRTIDIGGVGNALLIWSDDVKYACLVTPTFAICWEYNKTTSVLWSNCTFSNGVLTISSSTSAFNSSGCSYYYQVL